MRACMIGLGKLGLPVAEVMAEYHEVIGFDINPPEKAYLPVAETLADAIKARELIFVAVQTPHDPLYGGEKPTSHLSPKDFDYSHVIKVLDDLNEIVTPDQIVVLISTCLPGTVRNKLVSHISNCQFLYNPYLIAMGTVKADFLSPEMIIIGTETGDMNDGETMANIITIKSFYNPMMQGKPKCIMCSFEEVSNIF